MNIRASIFLVMLGLLLTSPSLVWAQACPEHEQDNDADGVCDIACTHADACASPFRCDDSAGLAECDCSGVPNWLYGTSGEVEDVIVRDGIAYVAQGHGGLAIYDLTTLDPPMHVTSLHVGGFVVSLRLYGDTLYLGASDAGLAIVDVTEPFVPELLSVYDTPGHAYGVRVQDGLAYIADGGEGLHIADVSDPSAPTLVFSDWSSSFAYDVEVVGTTVFLAEGQLGIYRFDASDPYNATRNGRTDTNDNGTARELVLVGDILYLADSTGGLWIYQLQNNTPVFQGRYDTGNFVNGLDIVGTTAYLGAWADGMIVVDVSNPTAPSHLATYATPGLPNDVFVDGSTAFISDTRGGLHLVDVSVNTNPSFLGRYHTLGWTYDVTLAQDRLFITDGQQGAAVFDVSNPRRPEYAYSLADNHALSILIQGDRAYVATDAGGSLDLYDITDLDAPNLIASMDMGSRVYGVAVEGDYAFLGMASFSLRVVDISNPFNPITLFNDYHQRGTTFNLLVKDGIGYLGKGWSGFEIKSFADPANPVVLSDFDTPGWQRDLFLQGNTLYVADAEAGVLIYDVHDPVTAHQIGVYDTPGEASGVFALGTTLYVADYTNGLLLLDVSDPRQPVFVDSHLAWDRANAIEVAGNFVYLSDTEGGLQVFEVEQCTCTLGYVLVGGMCELAEAPSSAGELVITEFMVLSSNFAQDLGEWVEIYNPGGSLLDLEGCLLRDDEGEAHLIGDLAVPAGEHVVLAAGVHLVDTHGFLPDYTYDGFILDDDGDEIVLECFSTEIDRVVYSADLVAEGAAAKLLPDAYDAISNDLPESWCIDGSANFGDHGLRGTPQQMNLAECALLPGDSCEEGHQCLTGLCTDMVCCQEESCNNGSCDTLGNGTCECDQGWQGDACDITSCDGLLSNDPTVCSGRGECVAPETCECPGNWSGAICDSCLSGWQGDDCELTTCDGLLSSDPTVCSGHGGCVGPDVCECRNHWLGAVCETCETGWEGDDCELTSCDGLLSNDPTVCSAHGACIAPDMCECSSHWTGTLCDSCEAGWEGDDCEITHCDGIASTETDTVCSGHGTCVGPEQCECALGWDGGVCDGCAVGWAGELCDGCDGGYWGAACEACPACVNGACDEGLDGDGLCACDDGWAGDLCDSPICEPACSENADCVSPGNCVCHDGFVGDGVECLPECQGMPDWTVCSQGRCFNETCEPLSENDMCEIAIPLTLAESTTGSLVGAHPFLPLDDTCLQGGLDAVDGFYSVVVDSAGDYEITLTPEEEVDLALAVWSGCAQGASCQASDEGLAGSVESLVFTAAGDFVIQVLLSQDSPSSDFSLLVEKVEDLPDGGEDGDGADVDGSDGGDVDGGEEDGGSDGGTIDGGEDDGKSGGGCGCNASAGLTPAGAWSLLLLLLALVRMRRY